MGNRGDSGHVRVLRHEVPPSDANRKQRLKYGGSCRLSAPSVGVELRPPEGGGESGSSCSSSISPTISSRMSSSVTMPRKLPVAIAHHRHRALHAAEGLQQARHRLVGIHEQRRVHRVHQDHEALEAEEVEEILGVDDADDLVRVLVPHRHARVRAVAGGLEHLILGGRERQRHHLVARHHDVAHRLVRQLEHVAQVAGLVGRDHARLLRLLDQHVELFERVHGLLGGGRRQPAAAAPPARPRRASA